MVQHRGWERGECHWMNFWRPSFWNENLTTSESRPSNPLLSSSPPSSDHLGTFQLFRGGPFPLLGVYGCSSESRISQNAKRVTFKDWSSFRISYMKRDLFRGSPSFRRADSLWWSFCGLESRGRYPYFWFSGCQKRQLETTGEGLKWSLSLSGENLTALR